jgi:hypothetical protein
MHFIEMKWIYQKLLNAGQGNDSQICERRHGMTAQKS